MIAIEGNEPAGCYFLLVVITTGFFEYEYREEERKVEYSIQSGIFDQENGTSDLSSCFLPPTLQTPRRPHGSILAAPSRRTGDPDPGPAHPSGLPALARLSSVVLGEGEGHDSGAGLPQFKSKVTQ